MINRRTIGDCWETFLKVASVCLLLGWSVGCAPASRSYTNTQMDFSAIQSVAVLPFLNLTDIDDAGERVRDTFMGMLLATEAIYVLPPGEVARGITRASIGTPSAPTIEQMKNLRETLEVDAVITGVLREYGTSRSGNTEANFVSLSLQMIETQTGTIVWSGSSTRGGITMLDRMLGSGGQPMNQVTEEVINDLLDELFK